MPTLFISDIHLCEERPQLTDLFLQCLHTYKNRVEALYILGDLFEAWIGDDDAPFNQKIAQAINDFSQTTPVYFLPGNRDFLIGKQFANKANFTLLPDPCVIKLEGEPVLLTHGDRLCTLDKKHLFFKKITSLWLVKKLFLLLPLKKRLAFANALRKQSHASMSAAPADYLDATRTAILRDFKSYQVATLIHGHTHQPCIEYFFTPKKTLNRIVLGDWGKQASLLLCSKEGKKLFYETL